MVGAFSIMLWMHASTFCVSLIAVSAVSVNGRSRLGANTMARFLGVIMLVSACSDTCKYTYTYMHV